MTDSSRLPDMGVWFWMRAGTEVRLVRKTAEGRKEALDQITRLYTDVFERLFQMAVELKGSAQIVRTQIALRFATEDDCGLILRFIRELALYEKAPEAVVATEEQLRQYGFGDHPQFEALIAELDGEPAGMALFHTRFSTWLGTPTLYLEDIFVAEAARGHNVGRRLMARLAQIALERGWGRIDFHVLDWNPARGFYQKLGFDHLEEWLRYGAGEAWLRRLAEHDEPG